ncbi:MAG: ATP-binding cassette domain-containing protein, partial [Pseudomonadota bacterium]
MLTFDQARVTQGAFTLEANFAVPTGARVSIIGASGAGKSTLLSLVAGFQPVAAGRILWA